MSTTKGKPTGVDHQYDCGCSWQSGNAVACKKHRPRRLAPKLYTDEDRRRLFAPIQIRSFGGRSWGGAFPAGRDVAIGRKHSGDRYGYVADHRDLDGL